MTIAPGTEPPPDVARGENGLAPDRFGVIGSVTVHYRSVETRDRAATGFLRVEAANRKL
jgi:hypothetical protein